MIRRTLIFIGYDINRPKKETKADKVKGAVLNGFVTLLTLLTQVSIFQITSLMLFLSVFFGINVLHTILFSGKNLEL